MGTRTFNDLGSVMTYIISPTRTVLVKDPSKPNALWKLPGGKIENRDVSVIPVAGRTGVDDETIVRAAVRETLEETGLTLARAEINLVEQERSERGVYYPHFCLARVSEQKLGMRKKFGLKDDGRRIMIADFPRDEVPTMLDFLDRHRSFVQEVERARA